MKIIIPLCIFLFDFIVGSGQISFNGDQDVPVSILDGASKQVNLITIDTLIFKGERFEVNCSSISIKRSGNNANFTICDHSFVAPFSGGQLKLNTVGRKSIIITKGDSRSVLEKGADNQDLFGRTIFQDAKILAQGSDTEKQFILDIWGINSSIDNNYLKGKIVASDRSVLFSSGITNLASDKATGILGFNVTKIADGFAKFLVSRVKKEMAIQFFKGVKDKINDPDLKDIQTLFTNSHLTLQNIDEEIYNYQVYLPTIKQSFEADLGVFPNKLSSLLRDPQSQTSIHLDGKDKQLRPMLSTFLDFGEDLKSNDHLGVVFADLKHNPNLPNAHPDLLIGIQSISLVTEALRDTFTTPDQPYWINRASFNQLLSDTLLFNCFMGLTLEKARKESIKLNSGDYLWEKLNEKHLQIQEIQNLLSKVYDIAQEVNNLNIPDQYLHSSGEIKLDLVYYFDLGNRMIQLLKPFDKVFDIQINAQELKTILSVSQSIHDIVKGFSAQQYSYGILSFTGLLELINTNNKLDGILKVLKKEAMFIAQIAEANTSDEVAAIIENFAAPVGSWRDKREARWNVAFDSYVGFGGYYITSAENNITKATLPTPIGFSVTTPWNWFTIMGSVVDIGPMVAFRFLDNENNVPNTYLKEIIAPGIFTSFNLDKLISRDLLIKFNIGYQQFPLLEKTTALQNNISLNQKSGWTASINVNIPIMTLYNVKAE